MVEPIYGPLLAAHHHKKLLESGIPASKIPQLGYRTVSASEAGQLVGHSLPGLLIPYLDPKDGVPYKINVGKWGRHDFFRLRPDWHQVPKAARQTYRDRHGHLPKYLSPGSSGNRPYFSPLVEWGRIVGKTSIPLVLTEGELKGDAACSHGIPTIAGAGVSAFVDRNSRGEWQGGQGSHWDIGDEGEEDGEPVSRFLPELDVVDWAYRPVAICFDSDIITKFPVRKAMESLLSHTRARAGRGFPLLLPNECGGGKNGLDDFLHRHGKEAFLLLLEAFHCLEHSRRSMVKYHRKKGAGGTRVMGTTRADGTEFCKLELMEPPQHIKALMCWAILKESWAYRPGLGWYRWNARHWEPTTDAMELSAEIGRFMDAQNWQDRNGGLYAYCAEEMARRCIIPEARWNPPDRVSFCNGTLNTQTQAFAPHSHHDYCTSVLPYEYNPLAPCPSWQRFLQQTTGGDKQLQLLLRAWVRWILTPKDRAHKFPVEKSLDLTGRKGSGKGTFLDVLVQLVGEENCGSASPESFTTPEGLGQLVDKAIAIDADASGYMSGVGNFNKVVSNEAVSVKKLFRDKTTTRLGVVVVRAYNDFIGVPSSGTEGLDRRLCVIPFNHPPAQPDYGLSEKLRAELPGIFAWAWSLPAAEAQAIIRWSGAISAVQRASIDRFASDHPEYKYLIDDYPRGRDGVQAYDLYQGYVSWAKRNGHKPCSNTKFGTLLNELGIPHRKGNGGAIFYDVPDMEKNFDIVGYLRISPGDSAKAPPSIQEFFSSNIDLEGDSAVSDENQGDRRVVEGCGGLDQGSFPHLEGVSEGSARKRVHSPIEKSVFGMKSDTSVVIAASATWYKRGSYDIPEKQIPKKYLEADAIPLVSLPEWLQQELFADPLEIDGYSSDGQRVRIRNARTRRISVFDAASVHVVSPAPPAIVEG